MPRALRLPGQDGKKMAELEGSNRRESANYNPEMRIKELEIQIRDLQAKYRALENKIKTVQKVTRNQSGQEIIIVK
tara:strand:+ start:282 stop:509 length:228 start_codon:yes stop_codon:yes gene_type:complete